MTLTLRTAKSEDIPAITRLLVANSAAEGGALYGQYTESGVEGWVMRPSPTFIALKGTHLAGVLFTATIAESKEPPVLAMLAARPAAEDAWIYGPVCVSAEMRGKQVLDALVNYAKQRMAGREGLLFINATNAPSLRAHQRLGMPEVAVFTFEHQKFVVLTV